MFFRQKNVETLQNRTDLQLTCTWTRWRLIQTLNLVAYVWRPPHTQIQSNSHFTSYSRKSQHKRCHRVSLKLSYICYTCRTASCFNPWVLVQMSIFRVCDGFGTGKYLVGWTPHQQVLQRTTTPQPAGNPEGITNVSLCVTVSMQPCCTLGST